MLLFSKMDGGQVIVFPGVQHLIIVGKARSNQFSNPSFYNALYGLWVLQLIAYGYSIARTNQFRKIGIQGVVGKSSQFNVGSGTISSLGQYDVQHTAGHDGILSEGFIEITYTKQQQGPGMLGFDGIVLLHQGGFLAVFGFAHA
ncbi:MAG: hypothetical protein RJA23_2029 [Bacteroidota bacterium]|jgi:hypothetical protein